MHLILAALFAMQLTAPQMGWKKIGQETIALQPKDSTSRKLAFKEGVRLRFDVDAEYGVTFLVRSPNQERIEKNQPCFSTHAIKNSVSCEMPVDFSLFAIADERKKGPQNKINIVMYVWTCIENCQKKAASN